MLIGYDGNGDVKFVFTDTLYLGREAERIKRPLTVDDFWPPGHGLTSRHVKKIPAKVAVKRKKTGIAAKSAESSAKPLPPEVEAALNSSVSVVKRMEAAG